MKRVLIAILASLLLFSACGSDEVVEKKTEKKTEKKVEKVEYTCDFTKDGGIIVNLTNPVNEIVNISVDIIYFNEEDKEIRKDTMEVVNVDVLAEVKTVFRNVPDDAADFAIKTSYKISKNVESFANIIDVSSNVNGRNITLTISNQDESVISSANVGVVFYDSNEIVAYSEVIFSDIPAKGKAENVIGFPLDIDGNEIMFDRVVADANNAYNLKK